MTDKNFIFKEKYIIKETPNLINIKETLLIYDKVNPFRKKKP